MRRKSRRSTIGTLTIGLKVANTVFATFEPNNEINGKRLRFFRHILRGGGMRFLKLGQKLHPKFSVLRKKDEKHQQNKW